MLQRTRTDKTYARKKAAGPGFVLGPRAETKQRMLDATLRHLREKGMGDFTLRQLAEALGTSHRLLIYHFGTKEGLLVAVAEEIEREQRNWLQSLSARHLTPMEQLRTSWDRVVDPQLDRHLRLFVEIYSHALQGRAHTAPLLEILVDAWLGPTADIFLRMGMLPAQARLQARLTLATARGLMLDVLTTGDFKATGAAWEHYISQFDRLPGAHKPTQS
jgi:AcrR family transcriptional regulator